MALRDCQIGEIPQELNLRRISFGIHAHVLRLAFDDDYSDEVMSIVDVGVPEVGTVDVETRFD